MLHILLGRAKSGKTTRIMHEIADGVQRGIPGNILIVPEQYSHEAERELCMICGDRMSLFAEVLSFTRLAARVENELGYRNGPVLDKGGRLLCMSLALDTVGNRLSVYGEARQKPELQSGLLSVVDNLKSACVSTNALETAAKGCSGTLQKKLLDLALIQEAYDAVTARTALDPSDRLTQLSQHIAASQVGNSGGIWLDGFTDFTAQELSVLQALLEKGAHMTVCLTCDPSDESEIFLPAHATLFALRRLSSACGRVCTEEFLPTPKQPSALSYLEQTLFSARRKAYTGPSDAIRLYRAGNLYEECELAAGLALTLVRENGAHWRDIVIAVRGFDDYSAALENTFAQYGIPLFLTQRTGILQKSIPALIDSALEIISGGWEYEDVFAYLKTGLAGLSIRECDLLENYVFLWELHGSAWIADRDWSLHPDGSGQPYTEETAARLQQLNALRRRASKPLLQLQSACKNAHTAEAFILALSDFLDELELAGQLQNRARFLRDNGQAALAAEYSQLWDIVVSAMEQCAGILGGRAMTLDDFHRLWNLLLSQYDVGVIPVAYDRVSAGDLDRMRRRSVRHLILLGASDDRIPAISDSAGLLTDDDREILCVLGIDLGTAEAGLYREMNLIYNSLSLPSETLSVAYSLHGADGSECRPSFLVQGCIQLFDLYPRPVDTDALKLNAAAPAFLLAAENCGPAGAAARRYFSEHGNAARLEALTAAAGEEAVPLSESSVRQLYGETLRLTASRVDRFSACPFSYFLQYGLRAKPRQPAGFHPPEQGAFVHYLLEHTAADIMAGPGFHEIDNASIDMLTDRYTTRYIQEELNDFRERSSRFIYLFRRLAGNARHIVRDMVEELRRSDFVPLDFELNFSKAGDIPPYTLTGDDNSHTIVTGIADRVDGWVHEGRLYVRVMDYKTGKKSFSLSDVCSGRSLQMLLYLFALGRSGKKHYGMEIVPAGVLYVPARDALISASGRLTPEALETERARSLRRSGLLLNDSGVLYAMEKDFDAKYIPVSFKKGAYAGDSLASAEQLGKLSAYLEKLLTDMAKELRSGSIKADPFYKTASDNACLWCDFAHICHFDGSCGRWRYAQVKKNADAWERIEGGQSHA